MALQSQTQERHIYLADDDQDDRMMFAEILSEIDQSIVLTEAENGLQLMEILNAPPNPLPEVILLDLNMPKQNGFECSKKIRSSKALKELNIVIFTTTDNPQTIETAMELGATFYAVKPSTFNELRILINKILKINFLSHENDRNFRLV